jgi:hypothetical protein
MPPALSILEQIAAAMKTRLETITEGAAYTFTPSSVVRPTRLGGYSPIDKLIILEQPSPEEGPNDLQGNYVRQSWTQDFEVSVFCINSDASTAAIDTTINERRADIETALMSDATFGGLALNTSRIQSFNRWITDDGSFEGGTVVFRCEYRVKETDPRVQG